MDKTEAELITVKNDDLMRLDAKLNHDLIIYGYKYRPQKDITAYEFSLIWIFVETNKFSFSRNYKEEAKEYLNKHNLNRHFEDTNE